MPAFNHDPLKPTYNIGHVGLLVGNKGQTCLVISHMGIINVGTLHLGLQKMGHAKRVGPLLAYTVH